MSYLMDRLLETGTLEISGCDAARSENTARLEKLGAKIAIGHDPSHALSSDLLVISSAIGLMYNTSPVPLVVGSLLCCAGALVLIALVRPGPAVTRSSPP